MPYIITDFIMKTNQSSNLIYIIFFSWKNNCIFTYYFFYYT